MALELTDVKYVGPALVKRLAEKGINSVEQLAAMPEDELAAVPGVGTQTAPLILHNAKALIENPPNDQVKPKKLISKNTLAPAASKAKTPKAKPAAVEVTDTPIVTLEAVEIDLAPEDVEALAIASALVEAMDDEEDEIEVEVMEADEDEGISKKQRKKLKKQEKKAKKEAKKLAKAERKAAKQIEKEAKKQAKALEKAAKKAEKSAKKAAKKPKTIED